MFNMFDNSLSFLVLYFISLGMVFLSACSTQQAPPQTPLQASVIQSTEVDSFLATHWLRPLAPQVSSSISLAPTSCASCHVGQYDDWKKSWHSHSMGPGVRGQLIEIKGGDRAELQSCLRCHAPLHEQEQWWVSELEKKQKAVRSRKTAESELGHQGLICAGCHVRKGQWYGPPRKNAPPVEPEQMKALPHGGWSPQAAFEDSKFCAACHQFGPKEYALNGKLLENTYEEWRQSAFAQKGETCQSCHMPERRHLWRGIHDVEMARKAVSVAVVAPQIISGKVSAELRVTNTGAGHYFPTYVTPKVFLEIYQVDEKGRLLPGTKQQKVINREVSLDLKREISDTRLAPGGFLVLPYSVDKSRRAHALAFKVWVEPDSFYARFYHSILQDSRTAESRRQIQQALKNAKSSAFTLYYSQEALAL